MTEMVQNFYIKKRIFRKVFEIYSSQDGKHLFMAYMHPLFITKEIILKDLKDNDLISAKMTSWRKTAFDIFRNGKKIGSISFPALPTFDCSYRRWYFELELNGDNYTSSGAGIYSLKNSQDKSVLSIEPHFVKKIVEVDPSFDSTIALMTALIFIVRIIQVSI